jgi:hypothetical protein
MSIAYTDPVAAAPRRRNGTFRFRARDVTGTHDIEVADVQRGTPSGAVAQSLAARMELPTDVPWSLRNDRTGVWLRDELPLDEQVKEDAEPRLTLTPVAHLGGGRQ